MGRSANKWSEQLWGKLLDGILKLNNGREAKRIFEKLVSEDEKKMIIKRLAAITLIRAGKSYREIGKILWLSPNTVSTIKKNIFGNHAHYKSYLAFYGGPTRWSHINSKSEKSLNIDLAEIISLAGKIFEPFLIKGLGVMGDRPWKVVHKRK
ncbi:MAG: hypothetical protein UY12_C0030G0002 [Parcubacteria group bacterium GW2011_GWA2_47_8b]|nr:MAG: hypothetical protein UY12_C0030G0002 [Parcubacteria group bacterium GW2011_GWA2_47_8b]KKU95011.1 MAG: hypothetical protein UY24_C0005G0016 [Parcubacteria group bacterium GW2011_GWA1_48_11b]